MAEKATYSFPLVLIGLAILGVLVAYGASVILPSKSVSASYGDADNGKSISVNEGTTVTIILDENPTTGYAWNMTATDGLSVTGDKYIQGGQPGLVGAGGTHEWTIKATGKGQQQLAGIYRRSWEPLTGSEKTFALKINVV